MITKSGPADLFVDKLDSDGALESLGGETGQLCVAILQDALAMDVNVCRGVSLTTASATQT